MINIKLKNTGYINILLFTLLVFSSSAYCEIDNISILDGVLDKYHASANSWSRIFIAHASWLFWTLSTISFSWTFGFMALKKSDFGEIIAELIKYIMFTSFFGIY